MDLLRRFWFEFELVGDDLSRFGYWPAYGVGVTSYNFQDAVGLMLKWVVRGDELPKISKVIENVDVSELLAERSAPGKLLP